jgi:hypothetical protein
MQVLTPCPSRISFCVFTSLRSLEANGEGAFALLRLTFAFRFWKRGRHSSNRDAIRDAIHAVGKAQDPACGIGDEPGELLRMYHVEMRVLAPKGDISRDPP